MSELYMQIKEVTPVIELPCKLYGEQKPLTKEERKVDRVFIERL